MKSIFSILASMAPMPQAKPKSKSAKELRSPEEVTRLKQAAEEKKIT